MRSTFATALIVLCASCLVAQDGKKYESKAGKYLVAFPGAPTTTTNKSGDLDLHVAIVQRGNGGLAVMYTDLPADVVKLSKPKDLLESSEKGLAASLKAKITTSKDLEFGKEKYPARQIVAEKDNINLRVTLVLVESRLYQVFVTGTKEFINGKDADKFLDSFEVAK